MAGLGPQGSLQHRTGTESTDVQDRIFDLQYRLIELEQTLDAQKIGIGDIKIANERIMSQLDNYSKPDYPPRKDDQTPREAHITPLRNSIKNAGINRNITEQQRECARFPSEQCPSSGESSLRRLR